MKLLPHWKWAFSRLVVEWAFQFLYIPWILQWLLAILSHENRGVGWTGQEGWHIIMKKQEPSKGLLYNWVQTMQNRKESIWSLLFADLNIFIIRMWQKQQQLRWGLRNRRLYTSRYHVSMVPVNMKLNTDTNKHVRKT